MTSNSHTVRTGDLAYYNAFRVGFIPCKVLAVKARSDFPGVPDVEVKLTATRGAYKRGEVFLVTSGNCVPRSAVYTSSGKYRIRHYVVIPD